MASPSSSWWFLAYSRKSCVICRQPNNIIAYDLPLQLHLSNRLATNSKIEQKGAEENEQGLTCMEQNFGPHMEQKWAVLAGS